MLDVAPQKTVQPATPAERLTIRAAISKAVEIARDLDVSADLHGPEGYVVLTYDQLGLGPEIRTMLLDHTKAVFDPNESFADENLGSGKVALGVSPAAFFLFHFSSVMEALIGEELPITEANYNWSYAEPHTHPGNKYATVFHLQTAEEGGLYQQYYLVPSEHNELTAVEEFVTIPLTADNILISQATNEHQVTDILMGDRYTAAGFYGRA